jgi:tetratricopeptide (TPR) repeat protein
VFHYWVHRDYDSALRELDRTVELQPNSAVARAFYAWIYRRRGEWKQSLMAAERAVELDPRDPSIPADIGASYLTLRRWSDAEHMANRALAIDPHHALAALEPRPHLHQQHRRYSPRQTSLRGRAGRKQVKQCPRVGHYCCDDRPAGVPRRIRKTFH